jgi:N-acetylmuramic acid 6-phosphate etherase
VYGSLMVDVTPTNKKLVRRACGIISTVTGCAGSEAGILLKKARGSAKAAIVMKKLGVGYRGALRHIVKENGFIH